MLKNRNLPFPEPCVQPHGNKTACTFKCPPPSSGGPAPFPARICACTWQQTHPVCCQQPLTCSLAQPKTSASHSGPALPPASVSPFPPVPFPGCSLGCVCPCPLGSAEKRPHHCPHGLETSPNQWGPPQTTHISASFPSFLQCSYETGGAIQCALRRVRKHACVLKGWLSAVSPPAGTCGHTGEWMAQRHRVSQPARGQESVNPFLQLGSLSSPTLQVPGG